MLSFTAYILGFALFFVAACAKGLVGFGVNIIAVPILSLVLDTKTAVIMLCLPNALNNLLLVWQWRDLPSPGLILRIRALYVSGALGMAMGTVLLVHGPNDILQIALGTVTLLYVLSNFAGKSLQIGARMEVVLNAPVGFFAGVVGGVSGITGPIFVAYLHSIGLEKINFVYSLGVIFLAMYTVQVSYLIFTGVFSLQMFLLCATYVFPLALGTKLGRNLQMRISQDAFNRLLLGFLTIVGIDLLLRGIGIL